MKKNISKSSIMRVYGSPGVTGRQAASKLKITYKTFSKKLRSFGIPIKKRVSRYPELADKEWLRKEYIDNRRSISQIAKDIGATTGAVHSALRFMPIEMRSVRNGMDVRFNGRRFGDKASNWKGGRAKYGKGYTAVYIPDHPRANKNGYVAEHRLVVEKNIGRYLNSNEDVHHVNGNKTDNRLENLEILTREQHSRKHFDACKEVDRLKTLLIKHDIDPSEA